MRAWTVEEVNQAIPRVRAIIERIRALVREGRASAEGDAGRVHGNGQRPAGGAATTELRDAETGLVDFPARSPSERPYWLCWLPDEPEVGWWHWPETGFAGRRPLSDPPD